MQDSLCIHQEEAQEIIIKQTIAKTKYNHSTALFKITIIKEINLWEVILLIEMKNNFR